VNEATVRLVHVSIATCLMVAAAFLVRSIAAADPAAQSAQGSDTPCYECFWKGYTPAFREELIAFYEHFSTDDKLVDAARQLVLARVRDDAAGLCDARASFGPVASFDKDPGRRLLATEARAFLAGACGEDPAPAFAAASEAARADGERWKSEVYRRESRGRFKPRFGDAAIRTKLRAPRGTTAYVLGESAIRVEPGWRVAAQMERVARDWISYQIDYDLSGRSPAPSAIVPWHEGSRIRDILAAVPITLLPVEGALAAEREGRWLAPDGRGVFRFEVLPDKVQYPSTLTYRGLALLIDTHGISSLVEPALRLGAQLVVGCGDHPEKMKAALALASHGVSVYFPCDRFVGDVLGYRARGTLIGSAPVRVDEGGAVIGDRPVRFSVAETIVAEDTPVNSNDRYYDAPARYFRRFAQALPLRLEIVEVDGEGESDRVVRRAEELGASAIAVRVMTEKDAAPVRAWLAGGQERRAVLFHTAPYPAGYRLFEEFPGRTTFGDPHPRYLR
jgi:hypothetical protein